MYTMIVLRLSTRRMEVVRRLFTSSSYWRGNMLRVWYSLMNSTAYSANAHPEIAAALPAHSYIVWMIAMLLHPLQLLMERAVVITNWCVYWQQAMRHGGSTHRFTHGSIAPYMSACLAVMIYSMFYIHTYPK